MFFIFEFLFWPLIIIGFIMFFVFRRSAKSSSRSIMDIISSQEDMASQIFFLLSLLFLGVALLAFNRDFGGILEWHTIVLITSLVGLFLSYYLKILYVLPISVMAFIFWWGAKSAEWIKGKDVKSAVIFSGGVLISLLLYSIGASHKINWRYKRFALVYTVFGLIFVTGALFFLSNRFGLKELENMTKGKEIFASWQISISYFLILISFIAITGYNFAKGYISKYEISPLFILGGFFAALPFFPELSLFERTSSYGGFYYSMKEFSSSGIIWAFFFNVFIFLEIVGLILLGYVKRQNWLINLGAFFLFILIIVKYFDWFFTFFDKSIFFISAGILLFVVGGFMEKGRRYMLSLTKN